MQIIRTNNHRFYYSFYANNPAILDNNNTNPNFKATTFKPFIIQKSALCLSELNEQTKKSLFGKFAQRLNTPNKPVATLAKWVLCLGTVSLLSLPVKGFLTPSMDSTPSSAMSALDGVKQKGEIVIATTKGDSTVFNHGDIQHGFGHDIADRYADRLGVSLNLKVYDTEQEALNAFKAGDVDGLLGESHEGMASVPLACNDDTAKKSQGMVLMPVRRSCFIPRITAWYSMPKIFYAVLMSWQSQALRHVFMIKRCWQMSTVISILKER